MKILLYLLVPLLIVTIAAALAWFRDRQPTSLESGVDAFQREMRALSPDAAPVARRRPDGTFVHEDPPRPKGPPGSPGVDGRPPGRDR